MTKSGEKVGTVADFILWGSKITADGDCSHESKRRLPLGRKAMTNLDRVLKTRHHFADKGTYSQSYSLSSGHVWMWELDHKEGWTLKNWCFRSVVLEKTLESPLDSKEIKPVNPKENQPWIFIGRTDAEAEAPILWPPDAKSWLTEKDPDAGKNWGQEEKAVTEDEMIRWHHWLNGHEFKQTQEVVKDREAGPAAVHGVAKNQRWPNQWTTTSYIVQPCYRLQRIIKEQNVDWRICYLP